LRQRAAHAACLLEQLPAALAVPVPAPHPVAGRQLCPRPRAALLAGQPIPLLLDAQEVAAGIAAGQPVTRGKRTTQST